jgi:hypothetical protein
MTCQKCDHTWYAVLSREYGIENFNRDKDAFCNKCGNEGIPGAEVTERDFSEERQYQKFKENPNRIVRVREERKAS